MRPILRMALDGERQRAPNVRRDLSLRNMRDRGDRHHEAPLPYEQSLPMASVLRLEKWTVAGFRNRRPGAKRHPHVAGAGGAGSSGNGMNSTLSPSGSLIRPAFQSDTACASRFSEEDTKFQ